VVGNFPEKNWKVSDHGLVGSMLSESHKHHHKIINLVDFLKDSTFGCLQNIARHQFSS
jgi:hypothetical protein